MDITLDYTTLLEEVKRSLSIIGKRSTDDNGNLLFTDITVGTNEETIINDYFRQAVIDLSAELSAFIVPTTPVPAGSPAGITLTIDLPDNHDAAVEPFIQKSCEAYCVSYALYSWFNITAPRITQKYANDCSRQVNAVIRLIHDKRAPKANASSYLDIGTTVA